MDAGFYRGTNADQDNRFADKEKKFLKQMKFDTALETKVHLFLQYSITKIFNFRLIYRK